MEMKEINQVTGLCFTAKVTLANLQSLVRVKARELYHDAITGNLEVTGPVYWVYNGMDGNPETVFALDIVLPVSDPQIEYRGNFRIKKLGAFKCLSKWHKGNWDSLPQTYQALFIEAGKMGLAHSGECREIYQHIDFADARNNLTEVQIGII